MCVDPFYEEYYDIFIRTFIKLEAENLGKPTGGKFKTGLIC